MPSLNRLFKLENAPTARLREPSEPYDAVHVPHDVCQAKANASLRVSEVWVVSEPTQLLQVQLANEVTDHHFLVFKLATGESLYGHEYQYLRVERKQPPNQGANAQGQALPDIRF